MSEFQVPSFLKANSSFGAVAPAAIFNLTQDICGEARIVERAFGIGTSALAEAVALIGERPKLQAA